MTAKRRFLLLAAAIVLALVAAFSLADAQEQTVGLFLHEEGTSEGYTLFKPLRYGTAYLIDNEGRAVHSWETGGGQTPYLLPDGSVIRTAAGGVRQLSWDGAPVWQFNPAVGLGHHDLAVLPNGNVLMIVREVHSAAEAIAAGRDPALLADNALWTDFIIEVEPTGATTGNVVWEWYPWDHLVQDRDPAKVNFGVVADHPELIDINFSDSSRPLGEADWHHTNAIDYNEEFDQIVVSVRHFSELWVIDHSTTTEQAAGHTGGDSGEGGDLLYRWGNPQAYRAGDASDQQLFLQHDTQWIDPGLPGEGNILVFNNGNGRPGANYSSIEEIVPPVDSLGNYALTLGQPYGPATPTWTYAAANPTDFYSWFISGAIRLPNGNTLIDAGAQGTFFEVTPDGTTVWEYVNPVTGDGPLKQGSPISTLGFAAGNIVFRAYRYSPDYPAFVGRDLSPGAPIELPKKDVAADTDGDTVPNDVDLDDDADGCLDVAELQIAPGSEVSGGRRHPHNFWDFYDVWTHPPGQPDVWVRDGAVNLVGDILGVLMRFGPGPKPPTGAQAVAQALTPPVSGIGYHIDYDRGPVVGADRWDRAPPDGVINLMDDILGVVAQFGHSCA